MCGDDNDLDDYQCTLCNPPPQKVMKMDRDPIIPEPDPVDSDGDPIHKPIPDPIILPME